MGSTKPARAATESDATAVAQPALWDLNAGGYFMRADGTLAGRLVRLADVVRWLMKSREWPRPHAAECVCAAMEGATPQPELFIVRANEFASLAPADGLYGGKTAAMIEAAKRQATQVALQREFERERGGRFGGGWHVTSLGKISSSPRQEPQPVEPGLPAALRHIRSWWTSTKAVDAVLDSPRVHAAAMAVRLSVAGTLWGYGVAQAATTPDVAQASHVLSEDLRGRRKGSTWTTAEKAKLRDQVAAAGHGGTASAARELGLSEARISQLIAAGGNDLSTSTWGGTRRAA